MEMDGIVPQLQTERLLLRGFDRADASRVQVLAGHFAIADTTLSIPHPYPPGAAAEWIATHRPRFKEGKLLTLAIVLRRANLLLGSISLAICAEDRRAELGYWVGRDYWGQGIATEAARSIVHHGFAEMGLNRISAHYLERNPASGRVMEKLGMTREGLLREHHYRRDKPENVIICGILAGEWTR